MDARRGRVLRSIHFGLSEEKLPKVVSDFLAAHIDSALQLEILLLLHKTPEKTWTAAEIDAELRINRQWVAEQLADLSRRGFLKPTQGTDAYQYAPSDVALASAVASLATWYSTHRVAILGMIYSRPLDKLRTFADAFRFRKDTPNG